MTQLPVSQHVRALRSLADHLESNNIALSEEDLLRELEDYLDIEAAKRAEAEAQERGEQPIPWEEAKHSLGF